MSDYTIWHNPKCSTSRFVLKALQDAGVGLTVRDYQKQPPTADDLRDALDRLAMAPRDLLRRRNTPYDDLGLGDPVLTDDALIAALDAALANQNTSISEQMAYRSQCAHRWWELVAPTPADLPGAKPRLSMPELKSSVPFWENGCADFCR